MRAIGIFLAAMIGLRAPAHLPAQGTQVYFGTQGGSIYSARLDPKTGQLSGLREAASVEQPTWVVASPGPILYAVSETGNDGKTDARLYGFRIDPATGVLKPIGDAATGAAGSTHFVLDPKSRTLFLANYGSGSVTALEILPNGAPGKLVATQKSYGTGPNQRRQQSPHTHSVAIDPSGKFVLAADLGADRIFVYRFDPASRTLTPAATPFVAAAPGSGPRHLLFHPNGRFVYANSELTAEITVYRWDGKAGTLQPLATLPTAAPDFKSSNNSAELAFAKDGRFLYVSNRGEDSIVAYRVDGGTGLLTEIQRVPSGGGKPWSFAIDPSGKWLVAANQGSGTVTVLDVDAKTGRLSPAGSSLSVSKPVSVTFVR